MHQSKTKSQRHNTKSVFFKICCLGIWNIVVKMSLEGDHGENGEAWENCNKDGFMIKKEQQD